MRIIYALVIGLALFCAGAWAQEPPPFKKDSLPGGLTIPPGDVAPGYAFPAVARLRFSYGSNPGCTGTLIAPHVLLTARHCILDRDNRLKSGRDIYFRPTRNCPEYRHPLSLDANHTYYLPRNRRLPSGAWNDEGAQGRDMALIRLLEDVPCADVRVARRAKNAAAAPGRLLVAGLPAMRPRPWPPSARPRPRREAGSSRGWRMRPPASQTRL